MITVEGVNIQRLQNRYYKVFNETIWILLLRQNSEDNIPFSSLNDAMYSPHDDKRYSILSTINNNSHQLRVDGKFEFLIEYPGYHKGYNQWRQTNYLLEETDTDNYVLGFEELHTDLNLFDKSDRNTLWKGLSISSYSKTLLDGTMTLGNWNFAFGVVELMNNEYIPTNINNGSKEELLWIRIPSISYLYLITSTYQYHFSFSIKIINLIFILS